MSDNSDLLQILARSRSWEGNNLIVSGYDTGVAGLASRMADLITAKVQLTRVENVGNITDGTFFYGLADVNERTSEITFRFHFTPGGADKVRNVAQSELGPRDGDVGARKTDTIQKPMEGLTVAFIEDQDAVAISLKLQMEKRLGAKVIWAKSHDALPKLLEQSGNPEIDVVVSDKTIAGQGYNGAEWIKLVLRGQKTISGITKETPMVLLSGNADHRDVEGVKAVVANKPIMAPELYGKIREAYRLHGKKVPSEQRPGSDIDGAQDLGEDQNRART